MEHIQYIACHHSGGTQADANASTIKLTLAQLDADHQIRWPDFKSSLGYYVGYNFVIFPDGSIVQTRKMGEETAAQLGHNFDTISICVIGNYNTGSPDRLDPRAVQTMKIILTQLLNEDFTTPVGPTSMVPQILAGTTFNLSLGHIMPHRCIEAPGYTECNGTSLPDTWARDLIIQEYISAASSIQATVPLHVLVAKLSTIITQWELAGSPPPAVGRACVGGIKTI